MAQPTPIALDSTQVLKLIEELDGVKFALSTLSYWAVHGIAPASVKHTGRTGPLEKRLYSLVDVARVRLLLKLRAQGVRMVRLRPIMASLEKELPGFLTQRHPTAVVRVEQWGAVILERGAARQNLESGQLLLPLSAVRVHERDALRVIAAA